MELSNRAKIVLSKRKKINHWYQSGLIDDDILQELEQAGFIELRINGLDNEFRLIKPVKI